jgi:hypothetical protein
MSAVSPTPPAVATLICASPTGESHSNGKVGPGILGGSGRLAKMGPFRRVGSMHADYANMEPKVLG